VSYTLPMVDRVIVPLVIDVSDHHTVFVRGFVLREAQGGVGSANSVVAAELSTVLVKLLVVIAIALAILSLTGGVPFTVKDFEADDSPAFAASSVTVTEAIVPYATRACEIVAVIVEAVPPGSIVTPSVEPFQRICAFVAKLLPVAVRVNAAEPAEIDVGLIELSVGIDTPVLMFDQALTRLKALIEPSPVV